MATGQSTVEFREVPGFPGYRVGTDGSVWNSWVNCRWGRRRTDRWKRMKLCPGSRGYLRVNLTPPEGGQVRMFRVHRLILEVFVGPCPEGMESRHLDGDRTNNRLDNLAWGTPEENRADIIRHGTRPKGEGHCRAILSEEDVRAIRRRFAAGELQRVLAEEFGTTVPNISCIVNGVSWSHVT